MKNPLITITCFVVIFGVGFMFFTSADFKHWRECQDLYAKGYYETMRGFCDDVVPRAEVFKRQMDEIMARPD